MHRKPFITSLFLFFIAAHIQAEDYFKIVNAYNKSNYLFDMGRTDEVSKLWSNDMVVITPWGSFTDIKKYSKWLKEMSDSMSEAGGTRHLTYNPMVNINKDTAELLAYIEIINRKSDESFGFSTIEAKLKKTHKGWLFTYLKVTPDKESNSEKK